ncbi:ribonuclease D [Rubellimicrobium sp. CFH 75288]|uniref:ribonuclease D n=1 Tax=Rubellimicrobium sp. CFH 75288 TaxID=2697034 RepID=UPI001412FF99|nr:ribonuclease D [Rubellimicrobium sp. CFH 75288]NAZ36188.1 ribonuclease D [Rubellimicrobium sp. CFH 75288]
MQIITTTKALAAFCERAARHPYVTVDTEFLRERTYWSKLCLVQLAHPGDDESSVAIIDPLAEGLNLDPLYALLAAPSVVKVFHAARQDIEIFVTDRGVVPAPLFDTQVAAMVCGFGEQASYETLVRKIAKAEIDKSSRFTDWSRRPLSEAQLRYAAADVTLLRPVYEHLSQRLRQTGRESWVAEEMAVLTDPATYRTDPADAWERVKARPGSARMMAALVELARFREEYAQAHDVPRSRVFKDDALVELATVRPMTEADLAKSRLLLREARRGEIAEGILAAIRRAAERNPDDLPRPANGREQLQVNPALAELLRVLLKAKAEREDVAPRLIASSAELDAIAAGRRGLPALQGWRREVFGEDALRLCEGKVGLAARGQSVVTVNLPSGGERRTERDIA